MPEIGDGMTASSKSPPFTLSKRRDSNEYERRSRGHRSTHSELISEVKSVDEENFTDPALDAEMNEFRCRLLR